MKSILIPNYNGEAVKQVQDITYMYLGASINSLLDGSKVIKKRLAIARAKLTDIQTSLKMNSLSIKIKLRLLHSVIFPVATCGCDAWTIKKTDSQRISSFEMWSHQRSNESIIVEIMPKERLIVSVRRRKLYYFGHLARRSARELGTSILEGKVAGKHSRGRPKATWDDNIKDWTGLSMHAAVRRAYDRQSWRGAATHPPVRGRHRIDRLPNNGYWPYV